MKQSANPSVPAAHAPRHATDDPHVFLIPTEGLPAGFAERLDTDYTPVAPRLAATAVLLRGGELGPEVLLLRRHARSGFAAGAWVFPGGVVDEGESPEATAIRETWEETGIQVSGDLLAIARWITPEPEPRRFDAWFFLTRVPAEVQMQLSEAEVTDACWLLPSDAVRRFREGRMKMLPPTVHTLRRLADLDSVEGVWEALQDAPVPTILPRMRRHPEGVAIEIPPGE